MALQTLARRFDIIIASVAVVVLILRAVLCGYILSPQLLSDETYYVTSAKYIFYLVGVLRNFTLSGASPENISVENVNGTPRIHISVNLTEPVGWIQLLPNIQLYNWLNIEHPIFAKLVYGALVITLGVIGGRIMLLALSAISVFLFLREIVKRYRLYAVPAIIVFVALSNVYLHLMYLYFLDTFMITFLLLTMWSIMRDDHSKATIFMMLAIASKEIAIIYLVPLLIFVALKKKERTTLLYILSIVVGLIIGYAPYLLFTSLDSLLRSIIGMAGIKDPFACRALCLFDVEARWGLFKIYMIPFLWIWFALPLLIKFAEREMMPLYFTGIFALVVYAVISFSRSVYIYYYGFLEPLSVLPMVSATNAILHIAKRS